MVNSIELWVSPAIRTPDMSNANLWSYYTIGIGSLIATVIVAFVFVNPKEMGLFLTAQEDKERGGWLQTNLLVVGAVVVTSIFRAVVLMDTLHMESRPVPLPFGLGHELLYSFRAGPYEEIAAAALLILCLRARWHPAAAIALVSALRGLYHFYHGTSALVWACLWSAVFAWTFLRYRQVMPIIIVHIAVNVLWVILQQRV